MGSDLRPTLFKRHSSFKKANFQPPTLPLWRIKCIELRKGAILAHKILGKIFFFNNDVLFIISIALFNNFTNKQLF